MQNKILLTVLFFLLSYIITNAQLWQNENNFERNVIIVTGSAQTEIPADNASFYFEVNGFANNLNAAIKNAQERVNLITEELFKIGLNERSLTTSQFKSSENFGDKAFLSSNRDFKALIKVQVNIDSISILEPALTTVSLMNPDFISNITFSLKDIETTKLETMKKAVEKAKQKASLVCKTLQINLGTPLYIEELQMNNNYPDPFNAITVLPGVVQQETTQISSIFVETIKIEASVKVIFSTI